MTLFDAARLALAARVENSVAGYRNQSSGFDPRSGEGARRFGGRFNSPHSFPVIYLCTTRRCVVAELTRQARRQSLDIDDLLPRELWKLTADLTRVLDLTVPATLESLDIERSALVRDDMQITRELGRIAHDQRFQAILSASATGVDHVLSIFPNNLAGVSVLAELVEEWNTPAFIR